MSGHEIVKQSAGHKSLEVTCSCGWRKRHYDRRPQIEAGDSYDLEIHYLKTRQRVIDILSGLNDICGDWPLNHNPVAAQAVNAVRELKDFMDVDMLSGWATGLAREQAA